MRHNSRITESYNDLNLPGHNFYASLLPALMIVLHEAKIFSENGREMI